jgi:ABC-type nitrate/sulfonate/bicarbonate transport system substrate-binding protein
MLARDHELLKEKVEIENPETRQKIVDTVKQIQTYRSQNIPHAAAKAINREAEKKAVIARERANRA